MTGSAGVAAGAVARVRHAEHVMGTVVSFDVPDSVPLSPVLEWLHWVDAKFSPFREDSDVSRLARGETTAAECVPEMTEVLDVCEWLSSVTSGYFTVYPDGRFDPCGYVKGWAIERAAEMLTAAGSANHIVNGGGDIQCRGSAAPGDPWRIGVAHPLRPGTLACAVTAPHADAGFAIATSGIAERGVHIFDPIAGRPAAGFASITVTGPRLSLADAYATAAFAMGDLAYEWIESLGGYEALAITPAGDTWQTPGFPTL
jgi:thiamine biosynthesis lipoprotein